MRLCVRHVLVNSGVDVVVRFFFFCRLQQPDLNAMTHGVVIGYDGRHNSLRFAQLAAAIFLSKNVPVRLFNQVNSLVWIVCLFVCLCVRVSFFVTHIMLFFVNKQVVATPLVPFGVLHFKASAGLMVTASHNPKEDNGYKVEHI